MRAVHVYFKIKEKQTCAYNSEFDMLVWKLAAIKNKKLGFKTILYIGIEDKSIATELGLFHLYDEVHYLIAPQGINLVQFWAAPKFLAIEEELKQPEDFFIVDVDLVFMTTAIKNVIDKPALFWDGAEPIRNYPSPSILSTPKNFNYPSYFNLQARPINTAIIKISDRAILREWLDVAWAFMHNNRCDESKTVQKGYGYMVTVEQRFLAIILKFKFNIQPDFFCSNKIRNFGPEHFHVWGIKFYTENVRSIKRSWVKGLLLLLQKESQEDYDFMLAHKGMTITDVLDNWDKINVADELSQYLK